MERKFFEENDDEILMRRMITLFHENTTLIPQRTCVYLMRLIHLPLVHENVTFKHSFCFRTLNKTETLCIVVRFDDSPMWPGTHGSELILTESMHLMRFTDDVGLEEGFRNRYGMLADITEMK